MILYAAVCQGFKARHPIRDKSQGVLHGPGLCRSFDRSTSAKISAVKAKSTKERTGNTQKKVAEREQANRNEAKAKR